MVHFFVAVIFVCRLIGALGINIQDNSNDFGTEFMRLYKKEQEDNNNYIYQRNFDEDYFNRILQSHILHNYEIPPQAPNIEPNTFHGVKTTDASEDSTNDSEDQWSVVWYLACFSGLITFFLVVSCSEWCCRKHVRIRRTPELSQTTAMTSTSSAAVQETPPPAYDLFAPPSYDSLHNKTSTSEKSEFDVYVVPVDAMGSILNEAAASRNATIPIPNEDEPPSYSVVNMGFRPDPETSHYVASSHDRPQL